MCPHRVRIPLPTPRFAVRLLAGGAFVLLAASCSPPAGPNAGSPPSTGGPGAAPVTGSQACDLITPEIAAQVVPGLEPSGPYGGARPLGSKADQCSYWAKSDTGMTALSVALVSPASEEDIAKAKATSDCAPVTGIGDFACLQWTGYFRGEAGGASANVVLTAVRGTETLEMPYVTGPPTEGGSAPDGNAIARALAQAAVDAGWGNGAPLTVPAAPPVGPPATTNNPVCAMFSAAEVRNAFGASKEPQLLPGEVSCRYTFGDLGTPGPDSTIFVAEVLQASSSSPAVPMMKGEPVTGIGDRATFSMSTEPPGAKSLRPSGDVPITVLTIQAVSGRTLATFVAQVLISPSGPSAEETKEQLINLVRRAKF
ncbi:hypothetical protein ACIQCN_08810 [Pseudarthrobacter sp. NPDC092424]|uniref:hypothetical protein n=1 Tax=Pseudarthrobacter sp. NPDC092424 TaxID=3364415 RepID=UPI003821CE69